jgi:hypothetical protein
LIPGHDDSDLTTIHCLRQLGRRQGDLSGAMGHIQSRQDQIEQIKPDRPGVRVVLCRIPE